MTTEQRTSIVWALALLMWVLAFALVVVLLARADGASVPGHPSAPTAECANIRAVRSLEQLVLRAGPPRSQTPASSILHPVGTPTTDTPPGGPAGGTVLAVGRHSDLPLRCGNGGGSVCESAPTTVWIGANPTTSGEPARTGAGLSAEGGGGAR